MCDNNVTLKPRIIEMRPCQALFREWCMLFREMTCGNALEKRKEGKGHPGGRGFLILCKSHPEIFSKKFWESTPTPLTLVEKYAIIFL